MVHVRAVSEPAQKKPLLAAASVHLPWGAPQQQAALIAAALSGRAHWSVPFVLGGDFNSDVPQLATLKIDAPLLAAGLTRVPAVGPTCLRSSRAIDHLYTAGVRLSPPHVG